MCRTKEKRVTRPASLSLLNPVHGAQVAPQRCPILRDGKKHFYDTICIRFMSMYNCCAEGVQFAATEVFSLLRRHCSVSNGAGVQRERYIHILTAPMLRELIDHINVYEKQGSNKVYTQELVIYYRFVGFISVPQLPEDENFKADTRLGVEVEYIPKMTA